MLVSVESDISDGLPMFNMVGFLSAEVKEAKDRVRTALKNAGLNMPVKRITVNISPASIKKSGTGFDLPIAVSVLKAMDVIISDLLETMVFAGELGLDGSIHGVNGILPMVLAAKEHGIKTCVVPKNNVGEASLVPGIDIVGVSSLLDVIKFLNDGQSPFENPPKSEKTKRPGYNDFSDINGMPFLRRACEVAVSGMHNMLLIGPPGSGKTFITKALPSIMPPLTEEEQLELSKIYSVCGLFTERGELMNERPFRSPHHTISDIGLTGGGTLPKPGEISLAHKGILFLDEMLEFRRSTIEILRQPLEEGRVNVVRVSGDYTFPADFMLVGAMNPCPCGYYPDQKRCRCSSKQIQGYLSKLSRPLLDRIDICIQVPMSSFDEIIDKQVNESSELIRERVIKKHALQRDRFKGEVFSYNSRIPAGRMEEYCRVGKEEEAYIKGVYDRLSLTARSYHKILKVARTIADMDGEEKIGLSHIKEAVCYRMAEGEGIYAGI